jgi:hypothetical protein
VPDAKVRTTTPDAGPPRIDGESPPGSVEPDAGPPGGDVAPTTPAQPAEAMGCNLAPSHPAAAGEALGLLGLLLIAGALWRARFSMPRWPRARSAARRVM